jgi:hypothetical protein
MLGFYLLHIDVWYREKTKHIGFYRAENKTSIWQALNN